MNEAEGARKKQLPDPKARQTNQPDVEERKRERMGGGRGKRLGGGEERRKEIEVEGENDQE